MADNSQQQQIIYIIQMIVEIKMQMLQQHKLQQFQQHQLQNQDQQQQQFNVIDEVLGLINSPKSVIKYQSRVYLLCRMMTKYQHYISQNHLQTLNEHILNEVNSNNIDLLIQYIECLILKLQKNYQLSNFKYLMDILKDKQLNDLQSVFVLKSIEFHLKLLNNKVYEVIKDFDQLFDLLETKPKLIENVSQIITTFLSENKKSKAILISSFINKISLIYAQVEEQKLFINGKIDYSNQNVINIENLLNRFQNNIHFIQKILISSEEELDISVEIYNSLFDLGVNLVTGKHTNQVQEKYFIQVENIFKNGGYVILNQLMIQNKEYIQYKLPQIIGLWHNQLKVMSFKTNLKYHSHYNLLLQNMSIFLEHYQQFSNQKVQQMIIANLSLCRLYLDLKENSEDSIYCFQYIWKCYLLVNSEYLRPQLNELLVFSLELLQSRFQTDMSQYIANCIVNQLDLLYISQNIQSGCHQKTQISQNNPSKMRVSKVLIQFISKVLKSKVISQNNRLKVIEYIMNLVHENFTKQNVNRLYQFYILLWEVIYGNQYIDSQMDMMYKHLIERSLQLNDKYIQIICLQCFEQLVKFYHHNCPVQLQNAIDRLQNTMFNSKNQIKDIQQIIHQNDQDGTFYESKKFRVLQLTRICSLMGLDSNIQLQLQFIIHKLTEYHQYMSEVLYCLNNLSYCQKEIIGNTLKSSMSSLQQYMINSISMNYFQQYLWNNIIRNQENNYYYLTINKHIYYDLVQYQQIKLKHQLLIRILTQNYRVKGTMLIGMDVLNTVKQFISILKEDIFVEQAEMVIDALSEIQSKELQEQQKQQIAVQILNVYNYFCIQKPSFNHLNAKLEKLYRNYLDGLKDYQDVFTLYRNILFMDKIDVQQQEDIVLDGKNEQNTTDWFVCQTVKIFVINNLETILKKGISMEPVMLLLFKVITSVDEDFRENGLKIFNNIYSLLEQDPQFYQYSIQIDTILVVNLQNYSTNYPQVNITAFLLTEKFIKSHIKTDIQMITRLLELLVNPLLCSNKLTLSKYYCEKQNTLQTMYRMAVLGRINRFVKEKELNQIMEITQLKLNATILKQQYISVIFDNLVVLGYKHSDILNFHKLFYIYNTQTISYDRDMHYQLLPEMVDFYLSLERTNNCIEQSNEMLDKIININNQQLRMSEYEQNQIVLAILIMLSCTYQPISKENQNIKDMQQIQSILQYKLKVLGLVEYYLKQQNKEVQIDQSIVNVFDNILDQVTNVHYSELLEVSGRIVLVYNSRLRHKMIYQQMIDQVHRQSIPLILDLIDQQSNDVYVSVMEKVLDSRQMDVQDIYLLYDNLKTRPHKWLLQMFEHKSNHNNVVLIFLVCLLGLQMPEICSEVMVELLSMINKYWSIKQQTVGQTNVIRLIEKALGLQESQQIAIKTLMLFILLNKKQIEEAFVVYLDVFLVINNTVSEKCIKQLFQQVDISRIQHLLLQYGNEHKQIIKNIVKGEQCQEEQQSSRLVTFKMQ